MIISNVTHLGVLCGDQLGKRQEAIWGDQVEVIAIVCLRDDSGLDWCSRVKMSMVRGLGRYLGDESIQFGDVLDMGVREKEASRGLQVLGTNRTFTRMESMRGGVGSWKDEGSDLGYFVFWVPPRREV